MSITAEDIVIKKEFEQRLVKLKDSEFDKLKESIENEGCRDSLVVWDSGDEMILVDGHNRYRICTELDIEFYVETIEFDSKDEALQWMDRNQVGRRNLTPADFKIVSGRIYNGRKKQSGGDRRSESAKSSAQVGHLKTSEEVAAELGVSRNTIKRNGQRAEVHDEFLEADEPEAAEVVRKAPQSEVQKIKEKLKEKPADEVAADVVANESNSESVDENDDPAVVRARAKIPELIKQIKFQLGNLGDTGHWDAVFVEILEFAR